MSKHRWMKFWPSDWRGDPALRSCSLAARGLWMEMISLAHEAEPYGHVLVAGKAPTALRLATIVGATERDVLKLLAELEDAGVFSRTDAGVIYSRRMVRDHQQSEEGRAAVARRWNKAAEPSEIPRDSPPEIAPDPNTPPNRVPSTPPSSLEAEAESEVREDPPTPRKRGRRVPEQDAFEEFWRYYPRKVGKGAARRAWARALQAAGGDADLVVGGVKVGLALERFDMREGGRYCPHPSTWLNGERWLDGLDAEDDQPMVPGAH